MLANHLYSRRRALEANLLLVEDGQYGEKRPGTPSMAKTVKSALRGVRWGARHRSPTPPCDTFNLRRRFSKKSGFSTRIGGGLLGAVTP